MNPLMWLFLIPLVVASFTAAPVLTVLIAVWLLWNWYKGKGV